MYNKKFIFNLIKEIAQYNYLDLTFSVLLIADIPSMNLVVNKTLALLNIPGFKDTMINCECLKCFFNIVPIFSVCERSKAASISSRI